MKVRISKRAIAGVILIFCIIITMFIGIVVLSILISNEKYTVNKFSIIAEEWLGTDDFVIESWDGLLIAKAKDGRQYPPQKEVEAYYRNRLITTALLGLSLLFVLFVIMKFLNKQDKQQKKKEVIMGE